MILNDWKGKQVKLIYSDNGRATPKCGILLDIDKQFISLETERGKEAFRVKDVIRMEWSGKNGEKD